MEQALRCNNQHGGYCRTTLSEDAVVTTCSHVFCYKCSKRTGLLDARAHQRACPVCSTGLPNNDDVVHTRLSPSEDYKTSVLSGLDPATIMECTSRALAFWTYQTTQEILYQEHLCKNLTDKYGHLSNAMDKIINEANSEISNLQTRISGLSVDQTLLQQKYNELSDAYRDKTNKHKQALQLYDALKKKYLVRDAQTAASANVNQTLQSIGSCTRPPAYQESLDPLQVYNDGIRQHKARSEHSSVQCMAAEQQRGRPPSETGDRQGVPVNMPPPPRPGRISHVSASNTPINRTALPAIARATANRSQIPMSTSRQDFHLPHSNQQSTSLGNQLNTDGPINHHSTSTPRGFNGMLNGMKVGRSGTAGHAGDDQRFGHYGGHTKQSYGRGPIHRPTNSLDNTERYFR